MKKIVTLAFLGALMASCSPYTLVNSQVYNDADLADYSTFRIVTPDDGHLPPGMQMVTYYNIAAAIREQMVERGYREDPNSPLLVNIGLTVKKEIDTAPLASALPMTPPPPAPMPPAGPVPPRGPVFNGVYPYFMYPRAYYWPGYYSNAQVITGIYREGVLTMDMVNIADKIPLYSASVATIMDPGDTNFRNLQGIAEAVQTLFSKFPVKIQVPYKQ
ncbi:MAG: DUF4136 domain-containing protein [Muribaculaceae bacterium]|nr:DUF4136 domain-containing protein [Muribaculaceae bacterium]